MKIRVSLREPEETHVVSVDAFDRREFETGGRRQIGLPATGPLQNVVQEKPDTYIAWLCWHNLHRRGLVDGWADYSSRHVDHEMLDAQEESGGLPDPTLRDRSRG